MEESFEKLLDMYMDEEEISKKNEIDNEELKKEVDGGKVFRKQERCHKI